MPTYTPTQYLLDHTHITSTCHKLYTLLDTHQFTRLASSEVFTTPFSVDYTAMFGGTPSDSVSPQDLVDKQWGPMMRKMVATQHMMSSVLVEGLTAPGSAVAEGAEEVKEAKVTIYVIAHLTKRKDAGKGPADKGGETTSTSNGGIGEYEVVKLGEEECRKVHGEGWDGNPWRVRKVKVTPKWYEGDLEGVLGKVVAL